MLSRFLLVVIALSTLLQPAAAADLPPFRIGIVAPFTGELKAYGKAILAGLEIARAEKPELFSRVQFILQDDGGSEAKAIRAFQKLRGSDKVMLIYAWGSVAADSIAPLAEETSAPVVLVSNNPASALNKKWVFRFSNYAEQYALVLLSYLRSKDVKRIGIVRADVDYINSLIASLKTHLRENESLVELASVQPDDTDLEPVLRSVTGLQIDGLGVFLAPGQISRFFREATGKYSAKVIFGTDDFNSMSEVKSAGEAMIGSTFPGNTVENWFSDRYSKVMGNDLHIVTAANAYDFAVLAAGLFRDLPDKQRNPDKIRELLRLGRTRASALGEYKLRESEKGGQFFDFPISMRRVRGDRIVPIPTVY